jgi:hypothetical protein
MRIGELKTLLGGQATIKWDDQAVEVVESLTDLTEERDALVVRSVSAENGRIVMHVLPQHSNAALQLYGFEFEQGM